MKHTKGQWYNDSYGEIISMPSQTKIARVHWIGGTEETEANAKLIAAAPDLLEALQKMVDDESDEGDSERYARCYRAIQKATS